ncbi:MULTISPECIES: efflux transporter outer membrane subunit [unclassified Sphingomonas]|uniref:efflux transporter outer membrane subunit n=1 Tax=unclassified Sphingomonas TaxID=196159 RepID=UPI000BDA6476|nr:MAG: RND transporter [Sphingomonas sp. 32-62-10]
MKRLIFPVIAALGLSGCVVGPDYARPSVAPSASGPLAEATRSTAASVPVSPLPDRWWRLYDDPVLDRLVAEALAHNTDIRVAAANLQRARAVLAEQRGQRLPTITPNAQVTRNQFNSASAAAFGGGGAGGGGPQTFVVNLFDLGVDASYELDLFGGISRAIEAGRGDAEAAAATLDAARVSVAAETARAYATACSNAAQAAVAQETVDLQQKTLGLTQTLFDAGRGTRRDVERADVLLAQTQAQLPLLDAEKRAALYALATLTGRPPAEVDADASRCTAAPRVTTTIPTGDGAALLARRPDVRSAERTLAADTARIGVAVSALYPSIRLAGSIGLNATRGSQLFKATSATYSFGPLISWNFPNQTAARAQIAQARAGADASLARFDGAVLTALREAETALARYAGALDRNAALLRAEQASSKAAALSRLRFDSGADSFLQLIEAERERADTRAARAASDAAVADAQITLFKALGGGWEEAPDPVRRPDPAQTPAP